jgi:regulator of sigma E protease
MFAVLVVAHEWGHFIAARIFGVRVDEFSIGFGPLAFKIGKRGATQYNVRWVPLGGYVRIAGMEADDEPFNYAKEKAKELVSSDNADSEQAASPLIIEADEKSDIATPTPDEFNFKPLWQRAIIIFAGPLMSFLFGVFIFCNMGWTTGAPKQINNIVANVSSNSVAQKMGLKAGDKIIVISGKSVKTGADVVSIIHASIGKMLDVTVLRSSHQIVLHGIPQPLKDASGKPVLEKGHEIGVFGFEPAIDYRRVGLVESYRNGIDATHEFFIMLGSVYSSFSSVKQNTGSVISIVAFTHHAVQNSFGEVLSLAGQLSFSLFLFNLLPIPILDGGYLLLFLVEALRRGKKLTPEQQQNFMLAGLVCIGLLFFAVMGNDIFKFFNHKLLP